MPAIVSKFMVDKFQELQAKAGAKRDFIDSVKDALTTYIINWKH